MNIKHEQFIGIYEDVFSKQFCEESIKYFENMSKVGFCHNRQNFEGTAKHNKNDLTVFAHYETQINLMHTQALITEFNSVFWNNCYSDYSNTYSSLQDASKHSIHACRVQKTEIGGGYHTWHFESSSREVSNRLMAWMVYLNDVEEGGETEFLYQHMRIKPKEGTLLIFPAGYTHTHRGNPPLSNSKYILTGWVEF